ncbi:MAG: putative DNA binding domain-containing protein, partial [Candidatus Aenigmarchaeota archaeon]|nr:putative DNA binding domain-containing protein [Candidatus Aenigmarchaeota archaeon]
YNSHGGKIILGVEDETRKLVGLKDPQKVEHKFAQIIRHWCKLDKEPEIEFMKYKNKDFIVIHCPKGKDTPYFVRGESKPRVRIGSSNMVANKEEIARLYREGSSKSQDIYSVENATLDDLDLEKIKKYLMKSKLTKQLDKDYLIELMLKEYFIVKENGELIPTIAGILLFGKNPHRNITQCEIRADRYVGDSMIEWIDRKDIHGTIFDMVNQAEEFMLKNMRTPARVVGFKTEFRTEYPMVALREAIINALVHRDWHCSEAVLLRMFNSHIDIINPGELLRPLKVSEILKDDYIPKSRNKILVEILSNSGIMDKRGTGFLRIREAMKKGNLPNPELKEKQSCFVIKFNNPAIEKIPKVDETGLNERQKKCVEYLKVRGKITTKEYVELVKTSLITAKRDLLDLKNKRIIGFVGSAKTGYYCFDGTVNDTVNKKVQTTHKGLTKGSSNGSLKIKKGVKILGKNVPKRCEK